jgi:pilus assembly protein CpaE
VNHPSISRVLIVHGDEAVARDIESVLRRRNGSAWAVRHAAAPVSAIQTAREFDPALVFLDLTRDRSLALSVARELRGGQRRLIGLLNPLVDGAGGEFVRQAVRAGVDDFVVLPLSDEELADVLEIDRKSDPAAREARTIAFFSHQGGVGTTTLAINTALAIRAANASKRVVLLDANVQFGSVASHLGIVPESDLAGAVRDLESGPILRLTSSGPEPGIALLPNPVDPIVGESIRPEDLSRVVIELRRQFDYVVVDTAPVLDLMTLAVLDLSETIVVVTEASAPTIAGTARLLRMLSASGIDGERVRLAVSRHRSASDVLPPEIIARELQRPVDFLIPFIAPVAVATHRGVAPLFDRNAAPFAEAVRRIARTALEAS